MQFAVIESYQEVAKPTSQRGLAALRDATNIRALAQMDRQRLHQVWRYRFSRVTIIAAVLCTIYGNVVAAQTTYVWNYFSSGPINTVGDNWSNPFRWTPSGPPPPTGSARIDTENFANLIFLSPSSSSPQDQSIRELVFDGVNPNFLNGRLFIDDLILNNVDMRSGVDLTDSPLSDALIATRTTIEDNSYIVVDQDSSSLGTLRINGDVQVAQFESFLSNPIEVVTHTGRILGNRSLGVEVRGRVVGSGTLTFGKEANTTARFSMSASTRTFPNEHAGGTNIEPAVILGIDDASLLGDDGATLQLGGRLQLDASMTLARPIAVYGQQAAEIDLNGRDLNISGPITGGTDLRIIGDRTLTLSGVENTHTGTLFISNDASLRLDANTNATSSIDLGLRANALLLRNEQVDNTARLRLRDNSVFDLNGFTETIGSILADDSTISGSGTLNVLGEIEGKVETRVNAGLLSIAGEFTGPLSTLTKTGDGALRLSGSSSDLFGLTRVDGGELLLDRTGGAQSNRFGAAVSNLRIGTGATVRLLRANQIRDNRDVSIDSFGQLNLEDIDETIRALIFVDGGGGSVVGSGTLTVTDTIERSGGGSAAVNPIGTPLALNGPNVTLNVVEGGLFAQSSVTSTGSVSKTGAGRFLTTAGNEISIASNLTISQGEMVLPVNQAVPEDATIPGTTTVGGTVSIAGNGVLELGDGTLNTARLAIDGSNALAGLTGGNGGILNISEAISVSGGGSSRLFLIGTDVTNLTGSEVTFEVLSGRLALFEAVSGPAKIRKTGSGGLLISGDNDYNGMTIEDGFVEANARSIQGTVTNNSQLTFNMQTAAVGGTFQGTISGTGDVSRVGTAPLTFNSQIDIGGNLDVTEGLLTLDPGAEVNVQGIVTVGATGELRLNGGTLNTGTITDDIFTLTDGRLSASSIQGDLIQDGGVLAPGASPGLTNIDGDYSLNAGTLEIEIGGSIAGSDFDLVTADSVTIQPGTTLDIALIDGFIPTLSNSFEVVSATSGIAGTFTNTTLPSFNGLTFDVIYESNRILLSVIQGGFEPGDYDNSGQVEQGDLNLVLNNWGQPAPFQANGDPFTTPNVDQEELNRVLNNWGASSAPSFAGFNVPEPGGLLAICGLLLASCVRRNGAISR